MKKVTPRLVVLAGLFAMFAGALQGCEQPAGIMLRSTQTESEIPGAKEPSSSSDPSSGSNSNEPSHQPAANGALAGTVTDAQNGQCISGFKVTLKRSMGENSGATQVSEQTISACGKYSFNDLPAGDYLVDFTHSSYIPALDNPVRIKGGETTDKNISLSKPIGAYQYRIVLNWMGKPTGNFCNFARDLDAYLMMSYFGESRILYWDKPAFDSPFNGNLEAILDHDVRNWIGPETVTIHNLNPGSVYKYYVNNYNNRNNANALGNVDATVSVYQGSKKIKEYRIPSGKGISYEVFQIVNGQIIDVGAHNDNLPVSQTQAEPCDWLEI